jgi:hypothetical protein
MGSIRFIKLSALLALAALLAAGAAVASGGGSTPPPTAASALVFDGAALADGNVGVSYASFITATGGFGSPYEFKVVAGKVPAGLTLAKFYGMQSTVLSGTPQTAGTSTFTVEVRDGTGHTARNSYTVVVGPPTPVVLGNSDGLNAGTVGASYLQNLFVSGGAKPYTWAIVAGALPAGLSLSANGSITGTPTTAGTRTFTIRVTDKLGQQATRVFSIAIS